MDVSLGFTIALFILLIGLIAWHILCTCIEERYSQQQREIESRKAEAELVNQQQRKHLRVLRALEGKDANH